MIYRAGSARPGSEIPTRATDLFCIILTVVNMFISACSGRLVGIQCYREWTE